MKKFISLVICLIVLVTSSVSAREPDAKKFAVPPLKYSYNALEPYIDEQTMKIHHDKHHEAYVSNLNKALDKYPELQGKTVEQLLLNINKVPSDIRETVRNNAGGHYNHTFFWDVMSPNKGGNPKGNIMKAIERDFGSTDNFKKLFKQTALDRFGSGWAWLLKDNSGKLSIMSTANQDTPIQLGLKPIIAIDVWEHAYYLKYQNKRADYIDAWWNVVNWDRAEELYNEK